MPGSRLLGRLASFGCVLVLSAGCHGVVTESVSGSTSSDGGGSSSTAGTGGTSGQTTTSGTGGAEPCKGEGEIDCDDGCGNFVEGYCADGQYQCYPIDPNGCGTGGTGGVTEPPAKWSAGYGDSADSQVGEAVAAAPDGGVVLAASFGGTIDFGTGVLTNAVPGAMYDMDIALAKFDANGQAIWSKAFGSAGKQWASDVVVDAAGDVFLAGTFEGDLDLGGGPLSGGAYLAKFDPAGNLLWSKGLPGAGIPHEEVRLAMDATGDVLVGITCEGGADLGGGALPGEGLTDVCTVLFDPDGQHIWSRLLGGPSYDRLRDVAIGPTGEVAVVGMFKQQLSLPTPIQAAGDFDAFIVALDAAGTPMWGHGYGDVSKDGAASVVWTDDGPVVTGWIEGDVDFGGGTLSGNPAGFVLWLDHDGGYRTSAKFWGLTMKVSGEELWKLAAAPWGGVVLGGAFEGALSIDGWWVPHTGNLQTSDIGLVRFEQDGSVAWARGYGDSYDELVGGLAVNAAGDILVTGDYQGGPDFGNGALPNMGNGDAYLARFPSEP